MANGTEFHRSKGMRVESLESPLESEEKVKKV